MKAIALISGGLDSILSAKIIDELGIELVAFNTKTPFCLCDHRSSLGCGSGARRAAEKLNLKFISVNVSEEFFSIIKDPKHGYGSNMNPCIDCRILLFRKARECMEKEGGSFIITGEVLGQRPMSQRLTVMKLIDREAGVEGLVLRPLSAKALKPTIPENVGWVDRDKLLKITGRGRREQIALANQFGIDDYPCPSGGCLLTVPDFSRRVRDLIKHQELNLRNVNLLKIGRHFRLNSRAKLIVGRNERENMLLSELAHENEHLFSPDEQYAGPTSLGVGVFDDDLINISAKITARYCDLDKNGVTTVVCKNNKIHTKFQAQFTKEPFYEHLRI
ncbi:MAG: hypothetical protein ABSE81_07305 [Candidatus Omnitrophota bacterium]|jgi:tRNA U34 2-thiouridine synthase MnmA/TrmU